MKEMKKKKKNYNREKKLQRKLFDLGFVVQREREREEKIKMNNTL